MIHHSASAGPRRAQRLDKHVSVGIAVAILCTSIFLLPIPHVLLAAASKSGLLKIYDHLWVVCILLQITNLWLSLLFRVILIDYDWIFLPVVGLFCQGRFIQPSLEDMLASWIIFQQARAAIASRPLSTSSPFKHTPSNKSPISVAALVAIQKSKNYDDDEIPEGLEEYSSTYLGHEIEVINGTLCGDSSMSWDDLSCVSSDMSTLEEEQGDQAAVDEDGESWVVEGALSMVSFER
jgi:hypothetical protein